MTTICKNQKIVRTRPEPSDDLLTVLQKQQSRPKAALLITS
jgi:hypothetical protein